VPPATNGVENGDGVCGADIVPGTGAMDGEDSWGWGEKTPVGLGTSDGIVCDLNGESPRGCCAGVAIPPAPTEGEKGPMLEGNTAPVVKVGIGEVGRKEGVSKPVLVIC